ncbi:MAG: hypothetical protein HPY79_12175 [Bacteroidales bacterium]|nr:hypothetical protein [Bacteroidales bacterium]
MATNIYGIQITNNTTGTGQSSGLLIGLAANGNARMVQQGQQSISLGTNNVDVLIYGTTANGTKTFEQNNCGSITASKQGFQSSSACSCNNLISDKSCDLNLFPINLYIYTQNNVEFVDLGTTINFYSSYTDGQAYYWEIFDNNNNLIYSQNTFSWTFSYSFSSVDTFYITVTVDNMTSPKYRIIVSKLNCVCSGFSIGSTCHVIKTNQYVKFWNLGYVPDEIKNDSCIKNNYASHASCYAPTGRRWITAYGTPYEYKTDIYPWGGTYPPDPWYYTTSFSHGGKYSIKYEIAMRINSQQPKMKLSLTNKPCSLFEWRIPCDLNLKIKK